MDTAAHVPADQVGEIVRRLVDAGSPRMIVLFGSALRGGNRRDSDIDLLVVVPDEIENTNHEAARLYRALRGSRVPVDLIVVREGRLRELATEPGFIYEEALATGRTVYAAA